MLIFGRDAREVVETGSEIAAPVSALVSGVEVMHNILTAATDTMAGGQGSPD
jgi:hypothetical protein